MRARDGQGDEAGVGAGGGDLQRELVLHVPHCEDAVLRPGRQPRGVRARRGNAGAGDGEGPCSASRAEAARAGRVHRGQAGRID